MEFFTIQLLLRFGLSSCFLLSTNKGSSTTTKGSIPEATVSTFGANNCVRLLSETTRSSSSTTTTRLNVWGYGGSESEIATQTDDDSVSVRIERTSANSRLIYSELVIPAPLQDVWSILTDYNKLSTHIPNLVESKIEKVLSNGTMGDGQFECRLYQKGAQKIIGFEFSASVSMNMKEISNLSQLSPATNNGAGGGSIITDQRKITFKCVDSFLYKNYDGEWKVQERIRDNGIVESILSYVVYCSLHLPVHVAALEWRIREDIPTNLRAVKKATLLLGQQQQRSNSVATTSASDSVLSQRSHQKQKQQQKKLHKHLPASLALDARMKMPWHKDETMAAYLTDH